MTAAAPVQGRCEAVPDAYAATFAAGREIEMSPGTVGDPRAFGLLAALYGAL